MTDAHKTVELSSLARRLTGLAGALYGLLGVVLFVFPSWSAERFPWSVSSFVAMTIGGWALGAAAFCALAVRDWRWSMVHPLLLFLWVFAGSELLVVAYHHDGLVVDRDHILSIPYLITLGITAIAALAGVLDWIRLRPRREAMGPRPAGRVQFFIWGFVALLALLVVATLWAPESALNGRVFPEPITPFTVRAFGVFYLSLGVAALPLLRGSMGPVITFMIAGEALLVPITVAALFNLDLFDLDDHPLNALYLGAYVVAGVVAFAIVLDARRAGLPFPGRPARRDRVAAGDGSSSTRAGSATSTSPRDS